MYVIDKSSFLIKKQQFKMDKLSKMLKTEFKLLLAAPVNEENYLCKILHYIIQKRWQLLKPVILRVPSRALLRFI